MTTILQRIKTYLAEAQTIIPDWAQYITDQSQPIDERWEAFLAAPGEWTNDVQNSNIPIDCLSRIFDSPYDDFYMDRGHVESMESLFDSLADKVNDNKITQDQYDEAREEVMSRLIGEWEYDW